VNSAEVTPVEIERLAGVGRAAVSNWRTIMTTCGLPEAVHVDPVSRWLLITRACVQPMTFTSAAIAGLLAWTHPSFDAIAFALAVTGIVLAHAANNMINDSFDLSAGLDTETYPRHMYSPHPVLAVLIPRGGLQTAIVAVNAAGAVIMLYLFTLRGWPVIAFALSGLFVSLFYTAPPLRLKARGLGEPAVLVVWGPLMVGGVYFASTGDISARIAIASLPYALLVATVLMGKHIDKLPWDSGRSIGTLPALIGERSARGVTLGMMAGFYVWIVALVSVGILPLPALLAFGALPKLIPAWRAYRRPRPQDPPRGYPVWPLWYAAHAFVHTRRAGALFLVGLAVAAALQLAG
jgi:1,4-dihydroxy-2-naphthoate octaprenyltransferase